MTRSKYKAEIEDLEKANFFLRRELDETKEKFIQKAKSLCKEILVVGAVCNLMDDYNILLDPDGKSEYSKKYKILSECRQNSFRFLFNFLDTLNADSELRPIHSDYVKPVESYKFNEQGKIEKIKEETTQ